MPSRSTESTVSIFTNCISESCELSEKINTSYSDFSRSFDSVNHRLLIRKLSNINVRGPALMWIETYLTGRTVQVKIKNYVFSAFSISSGVPQGSHLHPLLFILFINDITAVIQYSKLLIFAHNAKMYKKILTEKDLIDLQSHINYLVNWSTLNVLDFNIGIIHIISFHKCIDHHVYKISDVQMSRVNSIGVLGFILIPTLSTVFRLTIFSLMPSKFWVS